MKLKIFLFFIGLIQGNIFLLGQYSYGGEPKSFTKFGEITKRGVRWSQEYKHNTFALPKIDNEALMQEVDNMTKDCEDCPGDYYGKGIDIDFDLKSKAYLNHRKDGSKVWLLKVESSSAYALQFYFSKFNLPEGAELFFYNEQRTLKHGAFKHFNNPKDKNKEVQFGTHWLAGSTIFIEYYEPKEVDFSGELSLSTIVHVFADIFKSFGYEKSGPGSSGDCHVNVSCYVGGLWENEVNAVAVVLLREEANPTNILYRPCSGVLVNNTAEDGKPLFFTAAHCSTRSGINIENATFVFNYQTESCEEVPSLPDYDYFSANFQSIFGASILVDGYSGNDNYVCVNDDMRTEGDFVLLELATLASELDDYGVCYAGWDLTLDGVDLEDPDVVCIHHPIRDVKKISFGSIIGQGMVGTGEGHDCRSWEVEWDLGATEGGSSGAPLFNEDRRIIGLLWGGNASCTVVPPIGPEGQDKFSALATFGPDIQVYLDPVSITTERLNTYCPNFGPPGGNTGEGGVGGNNNNCDNTPYVGDTESLQIVPPYTTNAKFGSSVDIDGNGLIVGEPYAGRAFIYRIEGCELVQEAELNADGGWEEFFGKSVAISGNFAFVGSTHRGNSNAYFLNAVYVYFRTEGGNWYPIQKIESNSTVDGFGWSISAEGDYLVVGEPFVENTNSTGRVYFYKKNNPTGSIFYWQLDKVIIAPSDGESFGYSVSLSEDRVVVGAPGSQTNTGRVYFLDKYLYLGWDIGQAFVLESENTNNFGASVAISGDHAFVGGHSPVYTFISTSGNWSNNQTLEGHPGGTVSLTNTYAVLSDGFSSPAEIFQYQNASWNFQRDIYPDSPYPANPTFFMAFGRQAIATSGIYALIGGPEYGTACGVAYLYDLQAVIGNAVPNYELCDANFTTGEEDLVYANTINLGGENCDITYASGTNFDYNASEYILVEEGVKAKPGSNVLWRIEYCGIPPGAALKQVANEETVNQNAAASTMAKDPIQLQKRKETPSIDQVRIYPNPSRDGIFNIHSQHSYLESIEVLDVQGRSILIDTFSEGSNSTQINLSSSGPGFYFVRVKTEESRSTQKIIYLDK